MDLTSYKVSHGLKPIVLPQETRIAMAAAMMVAPEPEAVPELTTESTSDMFSFDLPDEKEATASKTIDKDDFFKFSDPPAAATSTGYGTFTFDDEPDTHQTKAVDDAFADLLESSRPTGNAPSTEPKTAHGDDTTAEYELSSFSWDEPGETPPAGEKKPDDDFESLFGDIDSNAKK
jgi:hypothetical protein